jgi:hypothetical protein
MADRTDPAQALDDERDFPIHPATNEALETAEFDNVEAGLFNLSGFVQPDGDLAMAFDAGNRIDHDLARGVFGGRLAQPNTAHDMSP